VRRAALPLAGAALLVAAAAYRLPHTRQILEPERNPFRRSLSPFDGPAFALIDRVAADVPRGAKVAIDTSSRVDQETVYFAMVASGMLPGRDVRAHVPWLEEKSWKPDYWIVFGSRPPDAPAVPVLQTPEGTLWRPKE